MQLHVTGELIKYAKEQALKELENEDEIIQEIRKIREQSVKDFPTFDSYLQYMKKFQQELEKDGFIFYKSK